MQSSALNSAHHKMGTAVTPHTAKLKMKRRNPTTKRRTSLASYKALLERASLHLEASGSPAATSSLELSALGDNTGLDAVVSVGVVDAGAVAEVSNGLASALGTTQKHGVGALGGAEGKLIQGDALTAGLDDSSSGGLGEAESSNGQSRNLQQTRIIGDSANDNGGLALLSLHVSGQPRNGNRGVVDLRHSESLHNGRRELGLCTSSKETIETRTQSVKQAKIETNEQCKNETLSLTLTHRASPTA